MSNHENAITPERLAEIKARCEKATTGKWCFDGLASGDIWSINGDEAIPIAIASSTHEDAEFIAHARQDIPDLIREVERLRDQ